MNARRIIHRLEKYSRIIDRNGARSIERVIDSRIVEKILVTLFAFCVTAVAMHEVYLRFFSH